MDGQNLKINFLILKASGNFYLRLKQSFSYSSECKKNVSKWLLKAIYTKKKLDFVVLVVHVFLIIQKVLSLRLLSALKGLVRDSCVFCVFESLCRASQCDQMEKLKKTYSFHGLKASKSLTSQ